ncbi:hypothetical protein [Saccharopolyspora hattusasensis]|uniref:hypothetical protein n=1 Tax=Saccharopolyspora hattusasensis TaxID=1128679 RepID=UPI003D967A2C
MITASEVLPKNTFTGKLTTFTGKLTPTMPRRVLKRMKELARDLIADRSGFGVERCAT